MKQSARSSTGEPARPSAYRQLNPKRWAASPPS